MRVNRLYILLFSSLLGYLFSLTGISIGWMIGALIAGGILSLWKPVWIQQTEKLHGIPKYWMFFGQLILGMELGQRINTAVFHIFITNWVSVIIILLVSILFSLLSGFILWRFSKTDILTSFIGTAPGGISFMPIFAEEVGANPALVSIIQIIRIILVIGTMPILALYWTTSMGNEMLSYTQVSNTLSPFEVTQLLWTVLLIILAVSGSFLAKYLKLPTPWLLGSMIVVALWQVIGGMYIDSFAVIYWPDWLPILSQIFIGVSIGSRLNRQMFVGIKRTLWISTLGSIGLIIVMAICATIMSKITGISWITAILGFAPGGIAEMAATAVALGADSTFVVLVQVLRIAIVITFLPLLFKFLERRMTKKEIRMTK